MKKSILTAFFALVLINANAQETAIKKDSVIILADTFSVANSAPVPYLRGTVIKSYCDTVYVINKMRFAKYELARKFVSGSRTCKELTAEYDHQLKEQDKYYKELMKSYNQADMVSQNLIKDTRDDLKGVSATLKNTSSSIDSVNLKFDTIKDLIKNQKWDSLKQKIAVGLGGLGAGILIGVLVAH